MTPIILAIDTRNIRDAWNLIEQIHPDPTRVRLKIGSTVFAGTGLTGVTTFMHEGYQVLLDLKWHDIPMQVAGAMENAAKIGVWGVTLHTSGGPEMVKAAAEVAGETRIFGVTVLTSSPKGIGDPGDLLVSTMTHGLTGAVCSGPDLPRLKRLARKDFEFLVPGVRQTRGKDDQHRVTTVTTALENGASYLVIGREVTGAQMPRIALRRIESEIARFKEQVS